jgi:hypothetical protein
LAALLAAGKQDRNHLPTGGGRSVASPSELQRFARWHRGDAVMHEVCTSAYSQRHAERGGPSVVPGGVEPRRGSALQRRRSVGATLVSCNRGPGVAATEWSRGRQKRRVTAAARQPDDERVYLAHDIAPGDGDELHAVAMDAPDRFVRGSLKIERRGPVCVQVPRIDAPPPATFLRTWRGSRRTLP